MPENGERVREYRERAQLLRAKAADASSESTRAQFMALAAEWDLLADGLDETRAKRS
jgi:hypothetical protein